MGRKRALVFDAHLGVVGGAQRVTGLLAAALGHDHDVVIASPERFDPARFGELYGVTVPPCEARATGHDVGEISAMTREFDLFISNQCPWIPPQAPRNFMYVHFPLHRARRRILGLPTPFRAPDFYGDRYERIMVNSRFTQTWVKRRWGLESEVVYVYPSLSGGTWDAAYKRPVILSVSRFAPEKAQEQVLESFLRLGLEGWGLILAGHGYDAAYVKELARVAAGAPVRLALDPTAADLIELYRRAWIFWHLRGMNASVVPDGLEHFGLVVVEAMSHGAIPVAFNGGGHPEIITPGSGFLVGDRTELLQVTRILAGSEEVRQAVAGAACRRAAFFNKETFDAAVRRIVG
jgi:glycosyltransferase involved in cell wall biosynthesis